MIDYTLRDFAGYAGQWPKFEWPNGARLALNVMLNAEEGAERNPLDGDPEYKDLSEASYPVPPGERDLMFETTFEYGTRAGVWRLIDIFDQLEVTPTINACALALERNPAIVAAIVKRDYDLCGHGLRWTYPFGLTEAAEREEISRAVASMVRTTGKRLLAWYARGTGTVATRRILAEEGFLFDNGALNDDLPYFQLVSGRPMLVVPYTNDLNDMRFWRHSWNAPSDFEEYCRDAVDILCEEGARGYPKMMSLGLHMRIMGRPGRAAALKRFLTYIRDRGDVWIATRTEIAQFWIEQFGPTDLWNWPKPESEPWQRYADADSALVPELVRT